MIDLDAFLSSEVKPALGCTEPGAVALAAAHAGRALGLPVEKVDIRLSVNVYKNGRSVALPNTGGLKGNRLAAALGALAGNPERGLAVLQDMTKPIVEQAQGMIAANLVTENVAENVPPVWVEATVKAEGHTALCRISQKHDRVEIIQKDGQTLYQAPVLQSTEDAFSYDELRSLNFCDLWDLASSLSPASETFLLEGGIMNMEVAGEGMNVSWGMGVGFTNGIDDSGVLERIRHATGGASDVRMSGGEFPIMSSAGSGNHGITAIIPVVVVAESLKRSPRELAEALALSHLVCGYLKAFTGRLTPICGCSVAAGAGAAGAMARLMGANAEQAERAVVTLVAGLLGMICDGAKETCSLKVATAGCEAYSAAKLALQGGGVHDVQGMVVPGIRELGSILAEFSQQILNTADAAMAKIMLKHQ